MPARHRRRARRRERVQVVPIRLTVALNPALRLDALDETLEDRGESLFETLDLDLGLLDVLVERERLRQSGKGCGA